MDPPSTRDPVALLTELIELLRAIKATGNVEHAAAAAVGAIQDIAARSKEPTPLVPHTELPRLADSMVTPGTLSHTVEPLLSPEPDTHSATHDAPVPPVGRLTPDIGTYEITYDAPTKKDAHRSHLNSPATIPFPSKPVSPLHTAGAVPAAVPPSRDARSAVSAESQAHATAAGGAKPSFVAQPETTPRKSRNLIVCIDGTSNQFSQKNTNVVELYHRLIKDGYQLTFYNSGIGTYAAPSWKSWRYYKQVIYNKIDLAIAWNFEKILLSAYLWLCENYREGDRIYLFGFSRGAYQVRALSAMIESVGLLYKGNQDQIPFAYQLYAETKHFKKVDDMRKRFKETFSWTVKVELVAVWDTVSSVGLVRNKTLPGTTDGMKHVRYFRHALALHERRVKFLPENAREGLGPREEDTKAEPGHRPHTKEVWFSGSHSNIGGGAMPNEDLKSFGPALRWVTFEAALAGVRFKDAPQYWQDVDISNSLTPIWKIFEVFPFARLTYRDDHDGSKITYSPHLGRPREIQEHQLIHETALHQLRSSPSSRWRARLPGSLGWEADTLRTLGLVEVDPYTSARRYVEIMDGPEFSVFSNDDVVGLRILVSTDIGRASLRDIQTAEKTLGHAIHRVLIGAGTAEPEDVHATLDVLLLVVECCGFIYVDSPVPEASVHAARIARSNEALARRLVELCASAMVGHPLEHPDDINCLTWLPDGARVISGCDDHTVRIWDVKTGQIVAAMTGHTSVVWAVAVSPDGTRIASGSADNTIRVWSVESGATVALLQGHEISVLSVAFSPDGTRVASGSIDRTIRVWDVATGMTVVGPINGHTDTVMSVVYSPDGSRIASGAYDSTVRVWDAETGECLWQAAMSARVNSVAYSPNGKRIVAGTRDVIVLDAETGETAPRPLLGHSRLVNSVAFSMDGRRIASGSDDETVRLWDAGTGEELDVLRGHRNIAYSVSFSPDSKYVASAAWDKTVRIWDATGNRRRW